MTLVVDDDMFGQSTCLWSVALAYSDNDGYVLLSSNWEEPLKVGAEVAK